MFASALGLVLCLLARGTAAQGLLDESDCDLVVKWINDTPVVKKGWWTSGCTASTTCSPATSISCDSKTGKIVSLNLTDTNLNGALPSTWVDMSSLKYLYMAQNSLTGELPDSWGSMKRLTVLDLSSKSNVLSGSLPPSWDRLKNLHTLNLSGNTGIKGRWMYNKLSNIRQLDLNGTSIDSASFTQWWHLLCTLNHDYTVILPNGTTVDNASNPSCPSARKHRELIVAVIGGAFLVALISIVLLRCCCCVQVTDAGCRQCKGGWVESLQQQWQIFSVLLDIGFDVWVLIQVVPTSPGAALWPFLVLLSGLLIPEVIASSLACWLWVSHTRPKTSTPGRLLWAVIWYLPFTVWLYCWLVKHMLRRFLRMFSHARVPPPPSIRGGPRPVGGLCEVLDPLRYGKLLSVLMALSEDPISAAVMSAFFLVNKRGIGQVLTVPAYSLNLVTSCGHILLEGWKHFPDVRREGVGGYLMGAFSIGPREQVTGVPGAGLVI